MTLSNFDKRVLIEQVRCIEEKCTLASEGFSPEHSVHRDFEDCLSQRAQYLIERNDLGSVLGRAEKLSRQTYIIALFVAALLGALGTIAAVTASHIINIYWLLLVLLGFNLLSMLLWVVGISLNLSGLIASVLTRLTSWLPGHLESRSKYGVQADRAWLACHFGSNVGKWQLSKITHELWLAYMLTGFIVLLLQLIARQYDFVWGTTLLSDDAFIKLTQTLSIPLQALGLATPSIEQVHDTQMGVSQTLTAAHRYSWAQFLLGALLLFGILPRLILWCWSALMRIAARRHFTLDYYLPYYINLHQQLMPLASQGQIIDADTSRPVDSPISGLHPVAQALPIETRWVSVELGDGISWPPKSIDINNDLGQVIDRQSLTRILLTLQNEPSPVIAIAVSAIRPPDRGVQRIISSLMSSSKQHWLVLLQQHDNEPISDTRLEAWYTLAKACKVPADHVISMSVS